MSTKNVIGRYVVEGGDTLTFVDETAFYLTVRGDKTHPLLVNHGQVDVSDSIDGGALVGIDTDPHAASARIHNEAGGVISVEATGKGTAIAGMDFAVGGGLENAGDITVSSSHGYAYGLTADDAAIRVTNSDHFEVDGKGVAEGLVLGGGGQVVNSGAVSVTASGLFGRAEGLTYSGVGSLTNSGSISANSHGLTYGVEFHSGVETFDNTGTITAISNSPEDDAYAVWVHGAAVGDEIDLDNSGTITAVATGGDAWAVYEADSGGTEAFATNLTNSGRITGDVYLGAGDDSLTNIGKVFGGVGIGKIAGFVDLGTGNDRFDGIGGHIDGGVFGGAGDDLLSGFKGADVLYGDEQREDKAHDGNDILDGWSGEDSLFGGGGNDHLRGGGDSDTMTGGSGADVFFYGDIHDSLAAHPDLITDLSDKDTIDLSHVDAQKGVNGVQAFVIVAQLDGHAGELALTYDAGSDTTRIDMDVDGDGRPDAEILASGDHHTFDHFVL